MQDDGYGVDAFLALRREAWERWRNQMIERGVPVVLVRRFERALRKSAAYLRIDLRIAAEEWNEETRDLAALTANLRAAVAEDARAFPAA